ncbi:MAG: EF-hand domain-containing protein [Novosphingobium sp.]|nr:EF-hand domain-containing protein [Novosphingobium sp.]
MKKFTLGLSIAALAAAGAAYAQQDMRPKMDGDGNGVVTRAEAQTHAAQMFERMDVNNDGKLDQTDRAARKAERRTMMFERMDADNSGQISRDEFMNAHQDGKHMGRHDRDGDGKHERRGHKRGHGEGMMMKMADTNNDGSISKAEFTTAAMSRFAKMDGNSDGKVTQEERQAARDAMRAQWKAKRDAAPTTN